MGFLAFGTYRNPRVNTGLPTHCWVPRNSNPIWQVPRYFRSGVQPTPQCESSGDYTTTSDFHLLFHIFYQEQARLLHPGTKSHIAARHVSVSWHVDRHDRGARVWCPLNHSATIQKKWRLGKSSRGTRRLNQQQLVSDCSQLICHTADTCCVSTTSHHYLCSRRSVPRWLPRCWQGRCPHPAPAPCDPRRGHAGTGCNQPGAGRPATPAGETVGQQVACGLGGLLQNHRSPLTPTHLFANILQRGGHGVLCTGWKRKEKRPL